MTDKKNIAVADTGFSESWLTLREPFDHSARSNSQDDKLASLIKPDQPLKILDLGSGTGSNLRHLLPRLGHQQHWTLVDNDARLLESIPSIMQRWSIANAAHVELDRSAIKLHSEHFSATIDRTVCDLANQLSTLPLSSSHLITGSALLDLTSAQWINQLTVHCVNTNCATLFVLNYNGKIDWLPEMPYDEPMRQQLNQHQLGDKGFGPALGPEAGLYFASQLEGLGRTVFKTDSPWQIPPDAQAMQQALLAGWSQAVIDQSAQLAPDIKHWQEQRSHVITEGQSSVQVGHVDILSLSA